VRQLVSVNVATLRQRAAELTKVASDRDLTLDELRGIVRDQAGLLACQADRVERVAAFEVRSAPACQSGNRLPTSETGDRFSTERV
jgi:hypothetical protein